MIRTICVFLILLFTFFSCSPDNKPIEEEEVEMEPVSLLTPEQEAFLEEYHFITFNKSPTSFGGSLNEKWDRRIRIYLDGYITDKYYQEVQDQLANLNKLFTDGIGIIVVNNFDDANIRLWRGPREDLAVIWPDFYSATSSNTMGYAKFSSDGDYNIQSGRIWARNSDMSLFMHELGHILGLGHASDNHCGNMELLENSVMCTGTTNMLSNFDSNVLKILYHPNIESGKTFEELKPIIEELIESGYVEIQTGKEDD